MGIIYFPYYDFPWFLHSMHYSHNLSPLLFSSPPPTPTHTLYTALLPIGKFITLKALDGLEGPLIHFHFLTLSSCYFLSETKLLRGPGARGYASLPYLANTLCSSKSVQRFPCSVEASPALPHQPFPCWVSAVPWGSWSPSPALSYSIVLLVLLLTFFCLHLPSRPACELFWKGPLVFVSLCPLSLQHLPLNEMLRKDFGNWMWLFTLLIEGYVSLLAF